MKILIHTYDTAFQNKAGGVNNRIVRIVEGLRARGLQVDFFDKYTTNIADYDCLHIFKLDAGTRQLVDYAKALGLKIVISTITSIEHRKRLSFYWLIRKLPVATLYRQLFAICDMTDLFIVETPKEAVFIEKYYHVAKEKIRIIPNGADKISNPSKAIYDRIGENKKYALIIGRFDKNKNQKKVIESLAGSKIDLVLVGGADPSSRQYFSECEKIAQGYNNIHILGWLDNKSELFESALSNASAIVCPSYQETFGLSIVEGMMAGAVPVISKTLPILEFDSLKDCIVFDPDDLDDIRGKIEKAINDSNYSRNKVEKEFSWEAVIDSHVKCYDSILR